MKVLVAGATGALGKQLVPRLVAEGHEVVGMTRSASKREAVRALGATPVIADALDPEDVARAVAEAEPEVIMHQLTALAGSLDMRHFDRDFALTTRLRTEGADHLLAAGRVVGWSGCSGSWPRALPAGPSPGPAGRSRPRKTRSIPRRRRRCAARSTRSASAP